MSKQTQPIKAQSIIPCECGHPDAFWHGPRNGSRMYMCSQCYAVHRALEILQDDHIKQNAFRLGALGANDLDIAISYLKQTTTDTD